MITFKGSPQDGGLYTGYNVIRDEQIIGFIGAGGYFRNDASVPLTADEQSTIKEVCKRVYEMPTEYGCLGVGESPTIPFEQSALGELWRTTVAVR